MTPSPRSKAKPDAATIRVLPDVDAQDGDALDVGALHERVVLVRRVAHLQILACVGKLDKALLEISRRAAPLT